MGTHPIPAFTHTYYPILNNQLIKLAQFFAVMAVFTILFLALSPPITETYPNTHSIYYILLLFSSICAVLGCATRVELSRSGITYQRYGLHLYSSWDEVAGIEIIGDNGTVDTLIHLCRPARIMRSWFSPNSRDSVLHFSLRGYSFIPDSPFYRDVQLFAPHILPAH